MTKKEKMMVTRMVMGGIGILCMLFSINEDLGVKTTNAENILLIIGIILLIPLFTNFVMEVIREKK